MTAACRRIRLICLFLTGFACSASTAFGQTQWSPSRSTTRPSAGGNVSAGAEFVPEWQRTPGRTISDPAVVRTSATTAFHESPRSTASRGSTSNRNGNTAQLSHDIQLAPGEQLVGQPRYTEGGPVRGSVSGSVKRTAYNESKGEVLPTPDGVSSSSRVQQGEVIHEGEHFEGDVNFDPSFSYQDGDLHGNCNSCGDGGCGPSCSSQRDPWSEPPMCPDCGMYGYHFPGCNRAAMCLENCYGFIFRESSVFAGVQSFKGPLDLGVNGNYGFNEGFNLVMPIVPFPKLGVGWQVGARWTQSNLSGNNFNSSSRDQRFITTGLFHRAYRNMGFQWGVAFDWLNDNYYSNTSSSQIRYEFSYLFNCSHEFGMWGTAAVSDDDVSLAGRTIGTMRPVDQYNFFYRYTSCNGDQARFWGGVTGGNLFIVGSDFRVPVSNRFDLVGGFNYIIPDDGNNNNGAMDESWNLSMNLVWYFGRRKDGIHNTPFRPLFNVADNGTMMFQPMF